MKTCTLYKEANFGGRPAAAAAAADEMSPPAVVAVDALPPLQQHGVTLQLRRAAKDGWRWRWMRSSYSEVAKGEGIEENYEKIIHCDMWRMMLCKNHYLFTSLYKSASFQKLWISWLFFTISHSLSCTSIASQFVYFRISWHGHPTYVVHYKKLKCGPKF